MSLFGISREMLSVMGIQESFNCKTKMVQVPTMISSVVLTKRSVAIIVIRQKEYPTATGPVAGTKLL